MKTLSAEILFTFFRASLPLPIILPFKIYTAFSLSKLSVKLFLAAGVAVIFPCNFLGTESIELLSRVAIGEDVRYRSMPFKIFSAILTWFFVFEIYAKSDVVVIYPACIKMDG